MEQTSPWNAEDPPAASPPGRKGPCSDWTGSKVEGRAPAPYSPETGTTEGGTEGHGRPEATGHEGAPHRTQPRGEGDSEVDMGVRWPRAQDAGRGRFPPRGSLPLGGDPCLANAWDGTSGLQDRVNVCCLKPPACGHLLGGPLSSELCTFRSVLKALMCVWRWGLWRSLT